MVPNLKYVVNWVVVPLVIWSLSVLEVNDVGAHLIQKRTEVTGADDGSGETFQPIFQPLDVVHVQVTRGFIQHQHVGVHQLGSTSGDSFFVPYEMSPS